MKHRKSFVPANDTQRLGIIAFCEGEPPYPPDQNADWQCDWETGWWAASKGEVGDRHMRELQPRIEIFTRSRSR